MSTTTDDRLNPVTDKTCPFCGDPSKRIGWNGYGSCLCVICLVCGARGPVHAGPTDALAGWNVRSWVPVTEGKR